MDEVKNLITDTLNGMMKSRDEYKFSEIQFAISETTNMNGESSCVISVATYGIDGWEDQKNA